MYDVGRCFLLAFKHLRHCIEFMARRRWTEERQRSYREADWIVGWLRVNGPANTRQILAAMNEAGIEVRAHVLHRALQRSQFIIKTGTMEISGIEVSLWDFDRDEESSP